MDVIMQIVHRTKIDKNDSTLNDTKMKLNNNKKQS